ncbi:MAG: hypothetical protein BGN97_11205 [Microbacterium sp. 69-10]|nr:MAG: hypothetical protein BGN97_11205 [Microbacterium sp. 69-10]
MTMVRGYDDSWALSDRQFAGEVEVEGEFYRRAVAVYTASRAATRSLIEDYGVDAGKITQVGAGTTLPGLADLTMQAVADRFAALNILFVGKDPVRKGLPELLEGFRLARRAFPGLTLSIVGPSEDAPEYHAEGVRWFGLVRDKARMAELYAQATVFALPAHRESYGLVVPEAMAYGLPCIVSDSGELPHLVEHGHDGRVLTEVSPEAIASAITALLRDFDEYARFAKNAHVRSNDFSWERIAQMIVDDLAARIPTQNRTGRRSTTTADE